MMKWTNQFCLKRKKKVVSKPQGSGFKHEYALGSKMYINDGWRQNCTTFEVIWLIWCIDLVNLFLIPNILLESRDWLFDSGLATIYTHWAQLEFIRFNYFSFIKTRCCLSVRRWQEAIPFLSAVFPPTDFPEFCRDQRHRESRENKHTRAKTQPQLISHNPPTP